MCPAHKLAQSNITASTSPKITNNLCGFFELIRLTGISLVDRFLLTMFTFQAKLMCTQCHAAPGGPALCM
jgi:predicted choloylglycine hydrolase